MNTPQYPALKESADRLSTRSQRMFLALNVCQLTLLVLTALVAGFSTKAVQRQKDFAWSVAILMSFSLLLALAQRLGKFDDRWFRCRAYAENFKSTVWRYTMSSDFNPAAHVNEYVQRLGELGERLPELRTELSSLDNSSLLLTQWMQDTVRLAVNVKASIYHQHRIEDQIEWYSKKSKSNGRLETLWFWVVFIIEFVAVLTAVLNALDLFRFNPTGALAALGAAIIGWTQLKRFSDLSTSYAIATGDLRRMATLSPSVQSQEELDALVAEVEAAVSREHSMWLERRLIFTR